MLLILLACSSGHQNEPTDSKPLDSEDPSKWFEDADGDGYGNPDAPAGERGGVQDATDCDDTDPEIHPGAPEICNGVDDDCDGAVDTDSTDLSTAWVDDDRDGYGTGEAIEVCLTDGYAAADGDCDDTRDDVNPAAQEVCGDGIDNDCDGSSRERCGPSGEIATTAAAFAWAGVDRGDGAGALVALDGDLDGDGRPDVVAYAPRSGSGAPRAAYVGPFGTGAMELDALPTTVTSSDPDVLLSSQPVVTEDDRARLVTPVWTDDSTWMYVGFLGPASGALDLAAPDIAFLQDPGHSAGASVAWLSSGDLALGATGNVHDGAWAKAVGRVYIVQGPVSGDVDLASDPIAEMSPHISHEHGHFGATLCAGDLDGDGIDDLAAGAPGDSGESLDPVIEGGAAFVVLGPHVGHLRLDGGWSGALVDGDGLLRGERGGDQLGRTLACGADANGDGLGDLLVGSGEADETLGAAYLVPGPATGEHAVQDAATWQTGGEWWGDYVGVGGALGDLDGDGTSDLLVGQARDEGSVHLFYAGALSGAASLDDSDATFRGDRLEDRAFRVAAGDGDGDGIDDLVIGAAGSELGDRDAGAVFGYLGGP